MEALHALNIQKNAVEKVKINQAFLAFFNRLFWVQKPNTKWRPILDLSSLNTLSEIREILNETPENISTSLQTGEWVMSMDFKNACLHIPI